MTDEELMQRIAETQDTAMQARLLEILKMPEDQREAAIADLTAAYDPLREDLRGDLERNFALATQEGPQGQMAGNNPYSVYVGASPIEHIASGVTKYKAGKDMRGNQKSLDELSKRQEQAQGALMSAQANALRGAFDPNETPEERRRRLMMSGAY